MRMCSTRGTRTAPGDPLRSCIMKTHGHHHSSFDARARKQCCISAQRCRYQQFPELEGTCRLPALNPHLLRVWTSFDTVDRDERSLEDAP